MAVTPLCNKLARLSLSPGNEAMVRPFRLAPKNQPTGPVEFMDIDCPSAAETTALSENVATRKRIFRDPHPSTPLRSRARQPLVYHNTTPAKSHNITSDRLAPKPSIPFNEDTDIDPYMLFPEKQWPFSALKDTSRRYREEKEAALEAKAQQYLRVRPGGEMTVEEWKEMFQRNYDIGKYAFRKEETVSSMAYSPMKIDG